MAKDRRSGLIISFLWRFACLQRACAELHGNIGHRCVIWQQRRSARRFCSEIVQQMSKGVHRLADIARSGLVKTPEPTVRTPVVGFTPASLCVGFLVLWWSFDPIPGEFLSSLLWLLWFDPLVLAAFKWNSLFGRCLGV